MSGLTVFRAIIASAAMIVALALASVAVRGAIDWHEARQPYKCDPATEYCPVRVHSDPPIRVNP